MKEYNEEKLHEYAKELFALCLDRGIDFLIEDHIVRVIIKEVKYKTYISEKLFNVQPSHYFMPIWELIEKVKQL